MIPTEIKGAEAIRAFVLAGRADFTIENINTGGRFTYRVRAPKKDKEAKARFVYILNGPDNHSNYAFVGTVFVDGGSFRWSPRACIAQDAKSVRAFRWFWDHLGDLKTVRFMHEGTCGRCGRKLTVPSSLASGLGPECSQR